MKNPIQIQLFNAKTGKLDHQQNFFNTVGSWEQQNYKNRFIANIIDYFFGNGSGGRYYQGSLSGDYAIISLLSDTFGVTGDNALANVFKVDPSINEASYPYDETNAKITGYCRALRTSDEGAKGGRFIPSLSGYLSKRSRRFTFEWGTTQAVGVIKACGFFPDNRSFGSSYSTIVAAVDLPELGQPTPGYFHLVGYKNIAGPDKHIYFFSNQTGTNNLVKYKASDWSFVETKSVDITGQMGSIRGTVYTQAADSFYQLQGSSNVSGGNLSFRKTLESANSFGAPFSIPFTPFAGWANTFVYFSTTDDNYIYVWVYQNGGAKSGVIKIDPLTDTVVSQTEWTSVFPVSSFGNGGNICPFTGKFFLPVGNEIWENADISDLSQAIVTVNDANTSGYLFVSIMEQVPGEIYGQYYTNNAYNQKLMSVPRGNFLTYAELLSPITKTNLQFLRLQYDLTF